MQRSKRVIFLSHCILNQNSVVEPLARAKGPYLDLLVEISKLGIGIFQMPCPEMRSLGLSRKPMEKCEYENVENFRSLCHDLALDVYQNIEAYLSASYEVVGIIGINRSPSCSISCERGIFMEELFALLEENKISIPFSEISTTYQEGLDNKAEIQEILKSLRLI